MIGLSLVRVYNIKYPSSSDKLHWFFTHEYFSDGVMISLCQKSSHSPEDVKNGIECENYQAVDSEWEDYTCKLCRRAKKKLDLLAELGE